MTKSAPIASVESLSEKEKIKKNGYFNETFELDASAVPHHHHQKHDKNDHRKKAKDFMDFDDLLPHFGEFGRYQKILFLLMIPFETFLVFVYFTQIFITIVPEHHWCHVPELQHLSIEERFVFILFK